MITIKINIFRGEAKGVCSTCNGQEIYAMFIKNYFEQDDGMRKNLPLFTDTQQVSDMKCLGTFNPIKVTQISKQII